MTYEEAKSAIDRIKEINEELGTQENRDAEAFVGPIMLRIYQCKQLSQEMQDVAERIAPGFAAKYSRIGALRDQRQKLTEALGILLNFGREEED